MYNILNSDRLFHRTPYKMQPRHVRWPFSICWLSSLLVLFCQIRPALLIAMKSTGDHGGEATVAPPQQCPVGWFLFEYGEKCFNFEPKKATFTDNFNWCKHLNSTMVSVHSKEENEFIRMLLNDNSPENANVNSIRLWLGAEQLAVRSNSYLWLDGSPFDFSNWNSGQPSCLTRDQHCFVIMGGDGCWNDSASSLMGNQTAEPLLCSQICQLRLRPQTAPVHVKSAALRERLERERELRALQGRLDVGLGALDDQIQTLNVSLNQLRSATGAVNASIRREIGLRVKEQEKQRLLLANHTYRVQGNLTALAADYRQLYAHFKAFVIVSVSVVTVLIFAAISACRSYFKIRKKYIHPHAVTALLDLNSQLGAGGGNAVGTGSTAVSTLK